MVSLASKHKRDGTFFSATKSIQNHVYSNKGSNEGHTVSWLIVQATMTLPTDSSCEKTKVVWLVPKHKRDGTFLSTANRGAKHRWSKWKPPIFRPQWQQFSNFVQQWWGLLSVKKSQRWFKLYIKCSLLVENGKN